MIIAGTINILAEAYNTATIGRKINIKYFIENLFLLSLLVHKSTKIKHITKQAADAKVC